MLIELKNIRKHFKIKKGLGATKKVVKAVNGVSLGIQESENVGLVGESGCGKSTLARMIMRLMDPDEGELLYNNKDITRVKGKGLHQFRKNVQMVFQDPYSSLDPRYSIRNIMKEAITLDGKRYKDSEVEDKILMLLRAVQLNEKMINRYPHEFSGGERQRIAIARTLMLNPKLLILDEAVSSLDVLVQDQILELLNALKKQYELTYLFISHNLKVVKRVCQKTAVMYQGRIVEVANTQELFEHPVHPYTRDLLSAALEYKAVSKDQHYPLPEEGSLVDIGNNHLVLK